MKMITEVFHCYDNAPIINQRMAKSVCMALDPEMASMALDPENTATYSEESVTEVNENKKILIDKLLGILDTAIAGLEQWKFVTEQGLVSVYRVKKNVLA